MAMHGRKKRSQAFDNNISGTGLKIGQHVAHSKFGNDIITNYEGSGEYARVQVRFDQSGTKWLVASFAKLSPI